MGGEPLQHVKLLSISINKTTALLKIHELILHLELLLIQKELQLQKSPLKILFK